MSFFYSKQSIIGIEPNYILKLFYFDKKNIGKYLQMVLSFEKDVRLTWNIINLVSNLGKLRKPQPLTCYSLFDCHPRRFLSSRDHLKCLLHPPQSMTLCRGQLVQQFRPQNVSFAKRNNISLIVFINLISEREYFKYITLLQ